MGRNVCSGARHKTSTHVGEQRVFTSNGGAEQAAKRAKHGIFRDFKCSICSIRPEYPGNPLFAAKIGPNPPRPATTPPPHSRIAKLCFCQCAIVPDLPRLWRFSQPNQCTSRPTGPAISTEKAHLAAFSEPGPFSDNAPPILPRVPRLEPAAAPAESCRSRPYKVPWGPAHLACSAFLSHAFCVCHSFIGAL